jgi:hypothetical protein
MKTNEFLVLRVFWWFLIKKRLINKKNKRISQRTNEIFGGFEPVPI